MEIASLFSAVILFVSQDSSMSYADQSYSVCQLERKIVETLPTHIHIHSFFVNEEQTHQFSSVRYNDFRLIFQKRFSLCYSHQICLFSNILF